MLKKTAINSELEEFLNKNFFRAKYNDNQDLITWDTDDNRLHIYYDGRYHACMYDENLEVSSCKIIKTKEDLDNFIKLNNYCFYGK